MKTYTFQQIKNGDYKLVDALSLHYVVSNPLPFRALSFGFENEVAGVEYYSATLYCTETLAEAQAALFEIRVGVYQVQDGAWNLVPDSWKVAA